MSVAKIKQLRKEKKGLVKQYKEKIKEIREDDRLAADYKRQQIDELQGQIKSVRQGHDEQIKELINAGKEENSIKMKNAEFDDLGEKELLMKLLIDNRNRDIESRAAEKYKDQPEALLDLARQEVESGSLTAPGYINALSRVNTNPFMRANIEELEMTHQKNTMNNAQKAYASELSLYEEQENEYAEEQSDEAFEAITEKYE